MDTNAFIQGYNLQKQALCQMEKEAANRIKREDEEDEGMPMWQKLLLGTAGAGALGYGAHKMGWLDKLMEMLKEPNLNKPSSGKRPNFGPEDPNPFNFDKFINEGVIRLRDELAPVNSVEPVIEGLDNITGILNQIANKKLDLNKPSIYKKLQSEGIFKPDYPISKKNEDFLNLLDRTEDFSK